MAELAFRLCYEEEGQGLIEYALILILISLLAVISMKNLASAAGKIYAGTAEKITGAYAPVQTNGDHVYGSGQGGTSESGGSSSSSLQNNLANSLTRSGAR